ncbi:hyaluronidase-1-like isoform X2 [Protopterus annectens]|uniref:hyaluronidase-1-like isoform X2 n=1 Tax=Protopterus annectens TaxID=7888 RepID=UPI001CF99166|nr:hyaluronidase-1-like isoform X2 [Protopterus annectens]
MMQARVALPLIVLWFVTQGPTPKGSTANVLFSKPFVTVWNAPTQRCKTKFDVDLDLSVFDIIANQNEEFRGQNVTIFYSGLLGYYPHYEDQTTDINGGIPQNASLKAHLAKAAKDIVKYIPREDFSGLAIIDWEQWKPVWERNWDSKDIYRQKSEELVRQKHPEWSKSKITKEAKIEFEQAAQAFMLQTQMLGQKLRPGGLWGFYSFPGCYNYDKHFINYTGKCPDIEISRNNELKWLWKSSTALYPSIYLPEKLKSSKNVQKYVHHRVKEALRVANISYGNHLPVLPYARIVYTFTIDFLTQEDLIHTIGESAALGAAGVVLWGDAHYSASKSIQSE